VLNGLEELAKLASQRCPSFPQPIPDYRPELEAALWWRLGEAFRSQDDTKALEWYEKALTRLSQLAELREKAASAASDAAYKRFEEKKYAECIDLLNRAIELKSNYAWAYFTRGRAYSGLEEYQRAIADYTRAIELHPNYVWAYRNRGRAYSGLEEYQRAIADYSRAIELHPKDAKAYHNRGNAYDNLKEYQRAIADYSRAIELHPNDTWAYYNHGRAYDNLKEYQRAIADYSRAIELDPKDATAYSNRGLCYLWLGNIQQARDDYSRSCELASTDISAAWMAEWIEMGKKRPGIETAVRLEEIASKNPDAYVAYVCLGVASGLRNKLREGLAELERAIPLVPERCDAYFWKGMLCAYLGRNLVAMEALEKALAVDLPPVLLTPLHWQEKDRPNFYSEYAAPLLFQYNV